MNSSGKATERTAIEATSRREFLSGVAALVTTARFWKGIQSLAGATEADSASGGPAAIRVGYAAITWGSDGRKAIEEISAVGFHGIQLRADAIKHFQPAELKDLLQQHGLTFVALSSRDIHADPALEADDLNLHINNTKFLREAGGLYLQVIDKPPIDRAATEADCKRLGQLLTELGKRVTDLGAALGYHNHMNSLSERPENLDRILENTDPRYIKLELDVAHYRQGGGDPVKAIHNYHDRLLFLHLKDVRDMNPNTSGKKGADYEWVELGRGKVDLLGVMSALDRNKFRGWAVVELDRVPDESGTPKQSAILNRKYVEEKLGLRL
jgi:inosose dehydratase